MKINRAFAFAKELARYPAMLRGAALRSRRARNGWKADLARQPSWQEVSSRLELGTGFVAENDAYWWGAFREKRDSVRDYLELGSWEGRSAVFAAWLFPEARISAGDWFANAEADRRFDSNTRHFSARLEKLKGTTWEILRQLSDDRRQFDLIFIDADHRFDPVLLDTILAWPLVRTGGYLIWDDYLWSHPSLDPRFNIKGAIDAWLATRAPDVDVIFVGQQVCVRKLAADPEFMDISGRLAWTGLGKADS
jgi:hypothetical protein